MTWTIYSIGDSAYLGQIITGVAAIVGTGDFASLARLGMIMGVIIAMIQGMYSGTGINFASLLGSWLFYLIMFGGTATVMIDDVYTGNTQVIAGVPLGIAATGSVISTVGYNVTALFEAAFGTPTMTTQGFNSYLETLKDVRINSYGQFDPGMANDPASVGASFTASWTNYISECVLQGTINISSNPDGVVNSILTNGDLIAALASTNAATFPGINITGTVNTTEDCPAAYNDLVTWTKGTFLPAFETEVLAPTIGAADGPTADTNIQTALTYFNTGATTSQYVLDSLISTLYYNAMYQTYNNEGGFTYATQVADAMNVRASQWSTESTLFIAIVRPLMAFAEGFIYAITPLLAPMMVLGSFGIRFLGFFATSAIWIMLWTPLMAIVNLYIYDAVTAAFTALVTTGTLPFTSFNGLIKGDTLMLNWVAVAQYMATTVPALSAALAYGSAQGFSSAIAGVSGGASHYIDATESAPRTLSQAPQMVVDTQRHINPQGIEATTNFDDLGATIEARQFLGNTISSGDRQSAGQSLQSSSGLSNRWSEATTNALLQDIGVSNSQGFSSEQSEALAYMRTHSSQFGMTTEQANHTTNASLLQGGVNAGVSGGFSLPGGGGGGSASAGGGGGPSPLSLGGSLGASGSLSTSTTGADEHGGTARQGVDDSESNRHDAAKTFMSKLASDLQHHSSNAKTWTQAFDKAKNLDQVAQEVSGAEQHGEISDEQGVSTGAMRHLTPTQQAAQGNNRQVLSALISAIRHTGDVPAAEALQRDTMERGFLTDSNQAYAYAAFQTLANSNPYSKSPDQDKQERRADGMQMALRAMEGGTSQKIDPAAASRYLGVGGNEVPAKGTVRGQTRNLATPNVSDSTIAGATSAARDANGSINGFNGAAVRENFATGGPPKDTTGSEHNDFQNDMDAATLKAADRVNHPTRGESTVNGFTTLVGRASTISLAGQRERFDERYNEARRAGLTTNQASFYAIAAAYNPGGVADNHVVEQYKNMYRERVIAEAGPEAVSLLETAANRPTEYTPEMFTMVRNLKTYPDSGSESKESSDQVFVERQPGQIERFNGNDVEDERAAR